MYISIYIQIIIYFRVIIQGINKKNKKNSLLKLGLLAGNYTVEHLNNNISAEKMKVKGIDKEEKRIKALGIIETFS